MNILKFVNFVRVKLGYVVVLWLKNKCFGLFVKDLVKLNVENFLVEMESESNKLKYFEIDVVFFEEVEVIVKDLCVVYFYVWVFLYLIYFISFFLIFCLD